MKKIIYLILIAISLSSICFAQTPLSNTGSQVPTKKTVGIFLEVPPAFILDNSVKDLMIRKAKVFFSPSEFNILPFEVTSNTLKNYHQTNQKGSLYPSAQQFTLDDILIMAKSLGCDYTFYITINKGLPSMSADFNSATYKTSITCEFRVLNVQNRDYLVRRLITKDILNDNIKSTISTNDYVYNDALERSLLELNLDISNSLK